MWSMHTGTSLGVLASKRKQITAVAAPVGRDVGEALEAMGNAVVDLLLVGIGLVVGLADTLGDDLRVAFAMASVFAIRALHARSILEKFST